MTIEIVCVGKIKESYWRDAVSEYRKRLGRFCRLEITELEESRLPDRGGAAEEMAVVSSESGAILARLARAGSAGGAGAGRTLSPAGTRAAADNYVIALDVLGKRLDSPGLAKKIAAMQLEGKYKKISFVIGGSLGLSGELLEAADMRLSFSDMTFPHQMMRVILLEQIYRAFKINAGETYHK